MARKFWERVNAGRIRFYAEPVDLRDTELDARIAEILETLALPNHVLAILAQNSGAQTEEEFLDVFRDELAVLNDQRDYFTDAVLVTESVDHIDHRWISPANLHGGAGVVFSVCGEEVGNEAALAIDGQGGTNWQHDVDEPHELIFDLGYRKRIDGIRVRNTATPNAATQLSGVDVFVAMTVANLDANQVGTALEFTGPNDNDQDLDIHNGRFVKLAIASTGHASNHITVRELELRTRPRTHGI